MKPVPVAVPDSVTPNGEDCGAVVLVIVTTAGATSPIAATTGSPLVPPVVCCRVVASVPPEAVAAFEPEPPHDTLHAVASRATTARSGSRRNGRARRIPRMRFVGPDMRCLRSVGDVISHDAPAG